MRKMLKKEIGITLVALIVTIIILLILAGISIATLTGSGLFEKARLAEQKSKEAQEKEERILSDYENKIGKYVNGSNRETVTLTTEQYNSLINRITALEENTIKFPDYNNVLTTITTAGASWTATEDCVITGHIMVSNGYSALISVDNVEVYSIGDAAATSSNKVWIRNMIYVKKGSVITTREYGEYNLTIYGLCD